MKQLTPTSFGLTVADLVRKALLAWLSTAALEYLFLPASCKKLSGLDGLQAMDFIRFCLILFFIFVFLLFIRKPPLERWAIACVTAILVVTSLLYSFTWPYCCACILLMTIVIIYAAKGWATSIPGQQTPNGDRAGGYKIVTTLAACMFFVFVSVWTVCRIYSFSTPTYDFGIFSQMFYSMKTTGLPYTTVERDGLLSHFFVHVSPIYYLLLPVYWVFPYPATLQILQAAVLASAAVPLWKLGKHHGLTPAARTLICVLLLLYPAYSGGTSYDIHENAFLTPLILWLLYFFDRRQILGVLVAMFLVISVKEDAAVYAAIIALYMVLSGVLSHVRWKTVMGFLVLGVSITWFIMVTRFLASTGDGVMTYRYSNFIFDNSGSLLCVIKAVLLSPLKVVYECVDVEKVPFILLTLLPFGLLPLLTRRYERYILLIPYILINLMSDYQYQHSIFFQYTFGSTACLFYYVLLNLADYTQKTTQITALIIACCLSLTGFQSAVWPKAIIYPELCVKYADRYADIRNTLSLIPDDASVSATTFYTTYLSQRDVLYDVQYASMEHILSSEYIVLSVSSESAYKKFASADQSGFDALYTILHEQGFKDFAELEDVLIILKQ